MRTALTRPEAQGLGVFVKALREDRFVPWRTHLLLCRLFEIEPEVEFEVELEERYIELLAGARR